MKWLTQWSATLRSNSLAPLSFRCQQTLGWELAEDTNPWPMFTFTINKYWVKSTPSWFCLCHLLFYGLLSQTMVWLSLLTGSFKRFVHCFQSAVEGWLCQQPSYVVLTNQSLNNFFLKFFKGGLVSLWASILQSPRNWGRWGFSLLKTSTLILLGLTLWDSHTPISWHQVGLQLAAKACFDVREAPAFWGLMELIAEVDLTGEI